MTPRSIAALIPAVAVVMMLFAPSAPAQTDDLQEANRLFRQKQFDRALDRVDAYLGSRPKDARGRFLKGIILTEQNRPNDAIRVFTELTQDYPELPEPYNNLAVLYASQGQYDKARSALEMAIRTHPSYATAHENLGDIYAKMASQAYDKALQLDRNNRGAQTKLNLIRDLFPDGARTPAAAAKPEPVPQVATAAPAPKPAPAAPAAKTAEAPAPKSKPAVREAIRQPDAAKPASTRNDPQAVLKTLDEWARAWSSNDVAAYLAHYAPDFQTPDGRPRADWETQRQRLIAKPRKIEVEVVRPRVTFEDQNRATVTFRQNYRSDTFKANSTKTLIMIRMEDRWLIQQEQVGG
ncbi:MAG: tetratricopeptide repeat protein [Burkholderiales bacterium]|nr:tetratricopeptide repeat protein [Burkholderiales bacterium]